MSAEIRASYTKSGLKQLRRAHADRWDQLVVAAGQAELDAARSASPLAWLKLTEGSLSIEVQGHAAQPR